MKRLVPALAAIVFVALNLGVALEASGHNVPARRTVTVQAEGDGAAILVTWTSARGPQGAQLLARASWGRNANALPALRALAASEALRGLSIELDGAHAPARSAKVKVQVDPGNGSDPARIVCAVLITLEARPGQDLVVKSTSNLQTGLRWFDRSNGAVSSKIAATRWASGRRVLRLHW